MQISSVLGLHLLEILVLLSSVGLRNTKKTDLRQLFQNYPQNQKLIANLGTGYEVVYPVQLGGERSQGLSTRQLSPENPMSHVSTTTLLIESLRFKIYVDLKLNTDLLPPTFTQFLISSKSRRLINESVENCYYHGTVRNRTDSVGAFRTCHGISGVLYLENQVYSLHPLHGDNTLNQPHLLFHHYKAQENEMRCGVGNGDEKLHCLYEMFWQTNPSADIFSEMKYIELALILDHAFFKMHDFVPEETVANAVHMINCADLHLRSLNTSISLVRLELWFEDVVHVGPGVDENLKDFPQYLTTYFSRISPDAVHVLSGVRYNDSFYGGAISDSICTKGALGITKVANIYKLHLSSHVITHMLGHNLGMNHDNDCCNCSYEAGCHMANNISSVQPFHFSSCSIKDYVRTLRKGYGACLFNMPVMRESICGNGILEKGEQCDCGTPEVCKNSDSCCDHVTCKFVKNAECSSGPCCEKCKLRSSDFLCRLVRGECDIPEYCDGKIGQCPMDLFKKNGVRCGDGSAYCYEGNCPLISEQCKELWGNVSRAADSVCYKKLNVQGTPNGNCGLDNAGSFVKCAEEDVNCGSLQCQDGEKIPITSRKPVHFKINKIRSESGTHECKAAPSLVEQSELPYGQIRDGTKCGFKKVCVNRTCIKLKSISSGCPKNISTNQVCSGHGVCTNINTCYCDEGWSGEDCSLQSDELMETSSATDTTVDLEYMDPFAIVEEATLSSRINIAITIVATSTVIGIALVICFIVLCIHKRNKLGAMCTDT